MKSKQRFGIGVLGMLILSSCGQVASVDDFSNGISNLMLPDSSPSAYTAADTAVGEGDAAGTIEGSAQSCIFKGDKQKRLWNLQLSFDDEVTQEQFDAVKAVKEGIHSQIWAICPRDEAFKTEIEAAMAAIVTDGSCEAKRDAHRQVNEAFKDKIQALKEARKTCLEQNQAQIAPLREQRKALQKACLPFNKGSKGPLGNRGEQDMQGHHSQQGMQASHGDHADSGNGQSEKIKEKVQKTLNSDACKAALQ